LRIGSDSTQIYHEIVLNINAGLRIWISMTSKETGHGLSAEKAFFLYALWNAINIKNEEDHLVGDSILNLAFS